MDQVASIRELVSAGRAESVSAFVQHAVGLALDDLTGWAVLLDEALAGTGGPMTLEEQAWADGVLGSGQPPQGEG